MTLALGLVACEDAPEPVREQTPTISASSAPQDQDCAKPSTVPVEVPGLGFAGMVVAVDECRAVVIDQDRSVVALLRLQRRGASLVDLRQLPAGDVDTAAASSERMAIAGSRNGRIWLQVSSMADQEGSVQLRRLRGRIARDAAVLTSGRVAVVTSTDQAWAWDPALRRAAALPAKEVAAVGGATRFWVVVGHASRWSAGPVGNLAPLPRAQRCGSFSIEERLVVCTKLIGGAAAGVQAWTRRRGAWRLQFDTSSGEASALSWQPKLRMATGILSLPDQRVLLLARGGRLQRQPLPGLDTLWGYQASLTAEGTLWLAGGRPVYRVDASAWIPRAD